jgi:hypothetical protein
MPAALRRKATLFPGPRRPLSRSRPPRLCQYDTLRRLVMQALKDHRDQGEALPPALLLIGTGLSTFPDDLYRE